jgi:multiple sugar transport system substrate-binding protein
MKEKILCPNKVLLIALAIVLLPALLFAGGSEKEAEEAVKEITIYWNPDHLYDVYDQVITEFAEEKGLTVNKQVYNWNDFKTKLNSDFAAGTAPDLIECPPYWFLEYATRNLMKDLTEEIDSWSESKDWFETTWIETTYKGRKYGMKLHNTCFVLFYNRDHFEEAGIDEPPATLEEMIGTINTIYDTLGPDIKGFGFDPTGQYLIPFMASVETPLMIENDRMAIDTPTIRKTLKTLQSIANSGKVFIPEPGGEEARTNVRLAFLTGRISMMISGPWEVGNILKNFPDLDYGVAMVPHLAGVEPRTYIAGTGIGIPADSKLPKELVWELMQRLTKVEVEVAATLEAGMLMPRKTWLNDPRVQNEKVVQLFKPILPKATPFDIEVRVLGLPEISWGGAVFKKLYETMIYSDQDMDKALDEYLKEANRLISSKL